MPLVDCRGFSDIHMRLSMNCVIVWNLIPYDVTGACPSAQRSKHLYFVFGVCGENGFVVRIHRYAKMLISIFSLCLCLCLCLTLPSPLSHFLGTRRGAAVCGRRGSARRGNCFFKYYACHERLWCGVFTSKTTDLGFILFLHLVSDTNAPRAKFKSFLTTINIYSAADSVALGCAAPAPHFTFHSHPLKRYFRIWWCC